LRYSKERIPVDVPIGGIIKAESTSPDVSSAKLISMLSDDYCEEEPPWDPSTFTGLYQVTNGKIFDGEKVNTNGYFFKLFWLPGSVSELWAKFEFGSLKGVMRMAGWGIPLTS
jgi:hypothetical protein